EVAHHLATRPDIGVIAHDAILAALNGSLQHEVGPVAVDDGDCIVKLASTLQAECLAPATYFGETGGPGGRLEHAREAVPPAELIRQVLAPVQWSGHGYWKSSPPGQFREAQLVDEVFNQFRGRQHAAKMRRQTVPPTRCRQEVVVTLIEEHRRVSLPFAPSDDRGESGFRIVNPTGRGHQRGAIAGKPDRGVTLPGSDRYRDPTSSQRAHQAEI